MKLTREQREFLKLVDRTADAGDGWRNVGAVLTNLVNETSLQIPDLVEIDRLGDRRIRVRLTEKGKTVLEYLT